MMTKQEQTVYKKSRGRPPGVTYTENIPARLTPEAAKAVDLWAAKNNVSRSEAVRKLIELGLKAKQKS